jgi:hypothetical protein
MGSSVSCVPDAVQHATKWSDAPLIRDRHGLRRSTQVGLARLARIWVPISGKPEIGVCSAPLRFAAPGTRAKHQPAAVGNGRGLNSIVSDCY